MYQRVQKFRLFMFIFFFLNVDSSYNIKDRLLKFSVVVLGIMTEGTYTMESIKCFQIFVIK